VRGGACVLESPAVAAPNAAVSLSLVQRQGGIALGRSSSWDGALAVKLAKLFLAATNKCLAQSNKSQDAAKTTKRCEVRLQQGSVAMLDRHITRRMILAPIAGIGALLLSGGAPAFAFNGPSFDCSHGVNSALAIILCNAPDALKLTGTSFRPIGLSRPMTGIRGRLANP